MSDVEERLRAIVDASRFMTLGTADGDGAPWASPVWYAHRDYREFVWVSKPDTRHSANLAARPQLGIVIFDSHSIPGEVDAVYMEATAEMVEGAAIEEDIAVFSRRSQEQRMSAWTEADVTGDAHLRLYRATATARYLLGNDDRRIPVDGHG